MDVPSIQNALVWYRADRGAEQKVMLPKGRQMTIFYFEWDQMDVGPLMVSGE